MMGTGVVFTINGVNVIHAGLLENDFLPIEEPKGVINKPQLDLSYFEVGKAFRVTNFKATGLEVPKGFDRVCLISSISPFSVEFVDFEKKSYIVNVTNIANGNVIFNELEEDI